MWFSLFCVFYFFYFFLFLFQVFTARIRIARNADRCNIQRRSVCLSIIFRCFVQTPDEWRYDRVVLTLNDLERRKAVILRYFTEFGSFRGPLRKSGWLAINKFSPQKCHKIHQLSTTDALCSSRWRSFLFISEPSMSLAMALDARR